MKISICSLLLAVVFRCIHAQDDQKEIKNDIGFNTSIILSSFFNSNGGPFNFMYKRQIALNKSMRYGTSFSANFNTHTGSNSLSSYYSIPNSFSITPTIGKEWHHVITKKWIWYCGGDIRPNVSMSSYDYYTNAVRTQQQHNNSYGISFAPFLGLRFVINERLYVATEANLNIGYSYQKYVAKSYDPTSGISTTYQDYATNTVTAFTGSAAGIFVFYRF